MPGDCRGMRYPHLRRSLPWVGLASVVATVAYLAIASLRPTEAQRAATDMLECIERRDAPALMRFVLDEERSAGLTEERLAKVLLGRPGRVHASLRALTGIESSDSGIRRSQGAATRVYGSTGGKRVALAAVIGLTEQGPRARVLHAVLSNAWRADALAYLQQGKPWPKYSQLMLDGIQRDRAFLESVGLQGMWLGPQDGYLTWSQLEARYRARL